ncbi:glycosyl hydrolase family 95 catalytic domain-containing protein [Pengzhenrongella sicca]|uniref:Glycoside hydrolase N-terminal domain-containing protein n=1 Tax=Pengzhenrongella sicca TaxID=2819238 RepID=A0A8A4ZKD3_9MICO|nr:glycoside hydrolase N-terminal domain-containing protein [Pengzhenrongella sicca]QTE30966.1 glycoside hydrolase N-terminal domain-containing protein [Pengzhenrongella sicca]
MLTTPTTRTVFGTSTPAATWEDGLVVGSGRVGAVVFGPADRQVLSLSHERFFLPVNARPAAPDVRPVLDELRAAVLDGDSARASALMAQAARASGYDDGLVWTDPLGICATLVVASSGGAAAARRSMDLLHGEVSVHWRDTAGGRNTLRVLAPRGEQTVWVALESELGMQSELELGLGGSPETALDTGGPDASSAVRAVPAGGAFGRVLAETGASSPSADVTAECGSPWRVEAGAARCRVTVAAGGRSIIRLDVAVGGQQEAAQGPATASWDALRARQARTHGALVGVSTLDLDTGVSQASTEQVWDDARRGDPDAGRRALEIAYLAGRAHIIASTGELPPTLQGVWQGTWRPAWSADYTLNGNVQNGTMAGLIPTGTPELARSLLALVLPFVADYRENARRVFGAGGMLLPARMSTHGRANHVATDYPHPFWVGCGGWVLRFAADLVSTTGDRTVVDDELWELVEGVLRFAETSTVLLAGGRHLVPSYSPENAPVPGASPLVADATMDVAILRDAARAAAVLARARGDDGRDARWAAVVADLPPYRVAADGTLAEWIADRWPENIAHRHSSQLYPLWYEPDPAFVGATPGAAALRAAAAATVAAKLAWRAQEPTAPPGRMEMAFGLVQLGLAAAALGDADSALTCARWLAIDHWRPALTTTHDAGQIFNLDASGGLPALVAAMLLGSTGDGLTVLPALPAAWPRGTVTGLRGRGGVVVDRLAWEPSGCTLTVRRLPAAAWLAPAHGTLLAAGRPFTASVDGPGARLVGDRLHLGERPATLRLDWAADGAT